MESNRKMHNSKPSDDQPLHRNTFRGFGLWLPIILILPIITSKADARNLSDVIQHTLPAYAIASKADILPQSSTCRKELSLFKEGVDKRILWSLRSKYQFL